MLISIKIHLSDEEGFLVTGDLIYVGTVVSFFSVFIEVVTIIDKSCQKLKICSAVKDSHMYHMLGTSTVQRSVACFACESCELHT